MLSQATTLQTLRGVGAVITGSHIVYTSGRHGSAYVNKDALYPHARLTSQLCRSLAEYFVNDEVEVVIAPAVGGVILSQWTGYHLTELTRTEVLSVYAEKAPSGEEFIIKRGYDKLVTGRKVLIVEDILNTGGSVRKVVEAVRQVGGNVVAIGALCNRGGVTCEMIGSPKRLFALSSIEMDSWDEETCQLCQSGVPINTDVGKGREFLARRNKE